LVVVGFIFCSSRLFNVVLIPFASDEIFQEALLDG